MSMMTGMMRKRLACLSNEGEKRVDFDEQEGIMRYDGLESRILNAQLYENDSGTSKGEGCAADSMDEDNSSLSSSKNGFGSASSHWTTKRDDQESDEWELGSPQYSYVKDKPAHATTGLADLDTMKERFAKLLLGEDVTGGSKGLSTALSLSNAITNLAASVFGELWKLEPLSAERRNRWRREIDWLLSPANHIVELVPAKRNGVNGSTVEIMIPEVRQDIQLNLPALLKLDSLLIEMLDSMVNTGFYYKEGEGQMGNGTDSKKWWLPSPQVPKTGLSSPEMKKLLRKAEVTHQLFKAAKSINQSVLQEMPLPAAFRDALPKPGRASLGEELYRALTAHSMPAEEMLSSLNLESGQRALETMNKLEGAILQWKERCREQLDGRSPFRTSWPFLKDLGSEAEVLSRAEALLQQLKSAYPNLPHTFVDVAKVHYGQDIGQSILEAYSRVLGSLAFNMLLRIGEILQEDGLNSPHPTPGRSFIPGTMGGSRIRHSLVDQMNRVAGKRCESDDGTKRSSVLATPSRSRGWCIGREACGITHYSP